MCDRMVVALLLKLAAMLVSGRCGGSAEVLGNASASAATTKIGNATNATTTTVDGLQRRGERSLGAALVAIEVGPRFHGTGACGCGRATAGLARQSAGAKQQHSNTTQGQGSPQDHH